MKICQTHWDKLKSAIDDRGIGHLGAKSGEQALDNAVEEIEGRPADFDPIMSCNYMIWNHALEMGGLYLMGKKDDDSDFCPICEAVAHKPDDSEAQWVEDYWIQGPAEAAMKECRERGLAPQQQ
jgi:hypothetical protein